MEQLQNAASKGPELLRNGASISRSMIIGEGSTETSKVHKSNTPPPEKVDANAGELEEGNSVLGEETSQSIPIAPSSASKKVAARTPPKKMLKVRSDGKLASPSVQASNAGPRRGRPRRSKDKEEMDNKGVVIIKYGKRKKMRKLLGDRINAILSAPTNKPNINSKATTEPSTAPPKPTHPFFTGQLAASAEKSDASIADNEKKAPTTKNGTMQDHMVFKKARVNSKPPGLIDESTSKADVCIPSFGTDHARINRFPGALEPSWPPCDMLHVAREPISARTRGYSGLRDPDDQAGPKSKAPQVTISGEDEILQPFTDFVSYSRILRDDRRHEREPEKPRFHRPKRHVIPGPDLQKRVCSQLYYDQHEAVSSRSESGSTTGLWPSSGSQAPVCLRRIYENIAHSRTAFEKFECETQDWNHKFAPKTAEQVLQSGREALMIRDWLQTLTVNSVGTQNDAQSAVLRSKVKKRKRKRARELDDFLVSSDEETADMVALSENEETQIDGQQGAKKSLVRSDCPSNIEPGQRMSHTIVLSGPSGCGKTATVFAIAQELGFEVFEINAGSRRSGRDILDRVGDMTRNHLVRKNASSEPKDTIAPDDKSQEEDEKFQEDLKSGRQGTMNSFFKSTQSSKKKQSPKKQTKPPKSDPSPKKMASIKPIKEAGNQKQSLILLEEVDILFEEDKMFWTTVLEMILDTRRPVIMTCVDESLIPFNDMALHGIFRLGVCPEELATDYLILVACHEGHLIKRDAVSALYRAKHFDLRAALTELQFYCQMALGDTKGGLEWMLLDRQEDHRVVSEDTYSKGLGWLGGNMPTDTNFCRIEAKASLHLQVCNWWSIDLMTVAEHLEPSRRTVNLTSPGVNLQSLEAYDRECEMLSLADLIPTVELRDSLTMPLDPTQPKMTDKLRCNYIAGQHLIQADVREDETAFTPALALTIRAFAARLAAERCEIDPQQTNDHAVIQKICERPNPDVFLYLRTGEIIRTALEPIARATPAVLGMPKGSQISAFDNCFATVAADLAPYVRSIAAYDLRLEEQRRQLSAALSQPGNDKSKVRRTRASRAALEGGSKANTRRERWLPSGTNYDMVLATGGNGWQEAALSMSGKDTMASRNVTDGSSRSSTPIDGMTDELA